MKLINAFKNQLMNEINNEFYSSDFFSEYCSLNCYLNDFKRENTDIEKSVRDVVNNLTKDDVMQIEDSHRLLLNALEQLEGSVLQSFQVDCVLFMIGDGSIDSHGMSLNGESILVIDLLAYANGYDKYNPISFLVHEAFHAYHYKLNPDFYFKNFTTVKETVFKRMYCEGLATYASSILTNESDADVFWLGYLTDEEIKKWIKYAEESKYKYVEMHNCEKLSPADKIRLFSVLEMDKLYESRIGYYYGFKVSEIIGHNKSLEELALMRYEDVEKAINEYMGRADMKLKKLDQCSEASYIYYCKTFKAADEMPFSSNLMNLDYKTWIIESKKLEDKMQLPSGYVPSHTFFLVGENEQLLGNISIRIALNDYLRKYGGNIGYVVSPEERGRKYGEKLLELALIEAKKLGLKEVLLTCDKSNIASSKTIIRNGGFIVSNDLIDGVEIERYLINL